MKISGLVVYLLAGALVEELSAQPSWRWLSPTPQGNVLAAVQAFDTNTVVAVGGASTIIRTTDGGNHWNVRHRVGGTPGYLLDMAFNDDGWGIAVGDYGKVLLTTDAGETWSTQSAGTTSHLSAVAHAGGQTWLAASYDGRLYRSTNGGMTWNGIMPAGSFSFNALHFVTSNTGFAVGVSGRILKTSDGGLTWLDKSVSTIYALRGAHFFTPDTGFVWGDMGVFFQTTDGGQTWSSRSNLPALWRVSFVSRSVGYATGAPTFGSLYKTTDGGENWTGMGPGNMDALSFANANVGFAVGDGILKTQNAGGSWQSLSGSIPSSFFRDVTFADGATGVMVGWDGKIYRTTNSGADWDSRWSGDYISFNGVTMKDSAGLVVGAGGRILRSMDKGRDWTSRSSGTTLDLNGIALLDTVAIAAGDSGCILRSTDLGLTWAMVSSGTKWGLRSVGFFSGDTVIIAGGEPYVGLGGLILRLTDKGLNWTTVFGVTLDVLNRVAIHGRTAIVTSLRGVVYVSTDCGTTWVGRWLGVQDDLYGVALNTDRKGLVVTGFGGAFSTFDGGATWNDETSPTANWLFGACYVNPDTAIVVGWNSTVLELRYSGTADINHPPGPSGSAPEGFVLDQNFPNPFNPTTTIQYQLLSPMYVRLGIFDLLGKEIRVLVNEKQSRGIHSATFDASGLPGGVYFYRLKAGLFTETKKLILLK